MQITLKVITEPDPGARSVIRSVSSGPVLRGEGSIDYLCGGCNSELAVGMPRVLMGDGVPVVIFCNVCNSYNELPTPPDLR